MKKIYFVIIFFVSTHIFAQLDRNPFDKLSKSLFENEMLSYRFFRNFVLIKTNTYKQRALKDMDQSIAKFDDNLSYIVLHLPKNKKIEDDFSRLQNLWNIYRMKITDYQKENYKSLYIKTNKLEELITELKYKIIDNHNAHRKNSTTIKSIDLMIFNAKKVDQMLISYILEGGLNVHSAKSFFHIDFSELYKNLKKISKYKYKTSDTNGMLIDLKSNLNMMSSIFVKNTYNPKMLLSYADTYSKKNFLLFTKFIHTINN